MSEEVSGNDGVTYLNKAARRQLTVLFCDLVGSVEISANLDVEDWYEYLRIYQNTCRQIIDKFDGHIAQYLGDGLLVYFGYPVAFENSAQSAINAALEIVQAREAIEREIHEIISDNLDHATVNLRVAVHTGPVVLEGVGEKKSADFLALGVTPAIAARLQDKAEPNTIVISQATYELVKNGFQCKDLEAVSLKGVKDQFQVYQVISGSQVGFKFDSTAKSSQSFVSREQELSILSEAWQSAKEGFGKLIILKGDPGIGKSRMLKQFSHDQLQNEDCLKLLCQCSPYFKDSALFPLINMIEDLLGIDQSCSIEAKLDKIESNIDSSDFDKPEALPLLAGLLSVPFKSRFPDFHLPANLKQTDLHRFYSDWLFDQSLSKPIYLLVEDYHWVDPSTVDFLKHLETRLSDSNMLLVVSHRPDTFAPWSENDHIQEISLGPLEYESAESLIKTLWGSHPISELLIKKIIETTDGVPLFIEECMIMAVNNSETGAPQLKELDIPTTLQDLLLARLDRVGESKLVAQLAATIGREFSYDLIEALTEYEERTLDSHLNTLIAAGLICVTENSHSSQLYFKHALIRDIAYQSMLSSQTKKIHKRLSIVLRDQFPDYANTKPEIIAYHLKKAASYQESVEYWQLAVRRAIGLHANSEAISHLNEALEIIGKLPEDEDRKRLELDLNRHMGGRLIVTKGYGADGVDAYFSRALQLAEELDDTPLKQKIRFGLEGYYFVRADFEKARKHLNDCLLTATKIGDTASILQVNWSLGEVFFHIGNHRRSQSYLNKCLELYKETSHDARVLQDPGVMGHIHMSWTKWISGSPEQSLASVHAAVTLAEDLKHPLSMAIAYSMHAGVNLFRSEYEQALENVSASIKLCEERAYQFWLAYSLAVKGRALMSLGQVQEGLNQLNKGIQMWENSGSIVTRPYLRAILAESLDIAGQTDAALEQIENGRRIAETSGEGYYLSEIYRIQGELVHKLGGGEASAVTHAKELFEKAITLAEEQQARSFKLRAETSLARLTLSEGHEQLEGLKNIYGWFTEGHDTYDLQQAKRLLKGDI